MRVEYNKMERAMSLEIHRYEDHIRYYERRIAALREEVEHLRGKIKESLESRGMDPQCVPYQRIRNAYPKHFKYSKGVNPRSHRLGVIRASADLPHSVVEVQR